MKEVFKFVMVVLLQVSLLFLCQLGFAEEYTVGKEVKKEDKKVREEALKRENKPLRIEEMVVTATRTETPIKYLADSITVIDHDEIEMKGQTDLYSVMKDVPGVSMKRCGGPGQWTYVRMRGGRNRHIKVMINGMDVSDPRDESFSDYWSYIDTDDIERIEIVRGPQSALYGSGAISGVINIITKKGRGKPKLYTRTEGGSMDTVRVAAGVNGEFRRFGYNVDYTFTDGGGVFDHEEHSDHTLSGRFDYSLTDNLNLDLTLRYTDSWRNYNEWNTKTFKAYDDPRARRDTYLFFSNIAVNQNLAPWWDYKLAFAYTDDRKYYDDPDDGVLDVTNNVVDRWSKGKYKGKKGHLFWQHNFHIGKIDTVSAGYEYENINGKSVYKSRWGKKKSNRSLHNNSWYINNQILLFDSALSLSCGGRLDDHSAFGDHKTYKLGLAYMFDNFGLKLKTTYGTGFKAPNMFQLYDARYGNSDLDPEESESWDVGFEQSLFQNRFTLSFTYFHNDFDNLIAYDYSAKHYTNRQKAESYGVEVGIKVLPLDDLSISVNYTYTDGEEDDKDLSITPKDDISANITYTPGRFRISADIYYVGDRLAYDYKHKIDEYTRVDVSSSYLFSKYFSLFCRIENLFDEDYEAAAGYPAPGISAWGGVKLNFEAE